MNHILCFCVLVITQPASPAEAQSFVSKRIDEASFLKQQVRKKFNDEKKDMEKASIDLYEKSEAELLKAIQTANVAKEKSLNLLKDGKSREVLVLVAEQNEQMDLAFNRLTIIRGLLSQEPCP